jgi:hypothetical protein
MPENEVKKMQALGFYRKIDVGAYDNEEYSQVKEEIDELSGLEPSYDMGEVSVLYEVHCNLDIDGFEDMDETGQVFTVITLKTTLCVKK